MTAEHPPARTLGRQVPDTRTIGIAVIDLRQIQAIRARFTAETGLAYTIPMTVHRIITEWRTAHE